MTPAAIFDDIAAHYHGRRQTAGSWVPWGDYWIEVVDCHSPADWTVHDRNRIVARGEADTPHDAWWAGCTAIAADLADERAAVALLEEEEAA